MKRALRLMVMIAGVLTALLVGLWLLRLWATPAANKSSVGDGMFNMPSFPSLREETILLVMGVDHNLPGRRQQKLDAAQRFEGARTDTMLLVRLSPKNNTISVVSMPRDSKVYLADAARVGKLNSAFSSGGADLAKAVIEYSFGVPVQYTVAIHLGAIRELVNVLGGVDVIVDKPMRYRDWTDGLNIALTPGKHHLSGEEALGYLRFRHDALADIGRIRRQQYFMSSLKAQLMQPASLLKLPGILEAVAPYVQTDLDQGQLMAVANFVRQVPSQNVRVATLPGYASSREAASYWIVSPYEAKQLLNRMMFNLPTSESAVSSQEPLKLGILYPQGEEGRAQRLADRLTRAQGDNPRFSVNCQRVSNRPASVLVESSFRLKDEDTEQLRKTLPDTAKWPIIVAPNNATYEQLGCSGSEDYTLVLGLDQVNGPVNATPLPR